MAVIHQGSFLTFFSKKEKTMSIEQIIKAWKDEDFRNSLSAEQLENLPENPTGLIELDDFEAIINGGATNNCIRQPGAVSGGGSSG